MRTRRGHAAGGRGLLPLTGASCHPLDATNPPRCRQPARCRAPSQLVIPPPQTPPVSNARSTRVGCFQQLSAPHLVVIHRHAVGHQVADGHDGSVPLLRQLQVEGCMAGTSGEPEGSRGHGWAPWQCPASDRLRQQRDGSTQREQPVGAEDSATDRSTDVYQQKASRPLLRACFLLELLGLRDAPTPQTRQPVRLDKTSKSLCSKSSKTLCPAPASPAPPPP